MDDTNNIPPSFENGCILSIVDPNVFVQSQIMDSTAGETDNNGDSVIQVSKENACIMFGVPVLENANIGNLPACESPNLMDKAVHNTAQIENRVANRPKIFTLHYNDVAESPPKFLVVKQPQKIAQDTRVLCHETGRLMEVIDLSKDDSEETINACGTIPCHSKTEPISTSVLVRRDYKKDLLIKKAKKRTSNLHTDDQERQTKQQKTDSNALQATTASGSSRNDRLSLLEESNKTLIKLNQDILKKLDLLLIANQNQTGQPVSSAPLMRCMSITRSNSVMSGSTIVSRSSNMDRLNEGAKFSFDRAFPKITVLWLLKRRNLSTREFVKELMKKIFKWDEIVNRTATTKGHNVIDSVRRDFIHSK